MEIGEEEGGGGGKEDDEGKKVGKPDSRSTLFSHSN